MGTVNLIINGVSKEFDDSLTYEEIVADYQEEGNPIAIVAENGKLRELTRTPKNNAEIKFFTLKDSTGSKCYKRTAVLITVKAVYDILGKDSSKHVKCEFSIGPGYYFSPIGDFTIDDEFVSKLKVRMDEIVAAKMSISKHTYDTDKARKLFAVVGMNDKDKLFKYRKSSSVNVYSLDDYSDYYYGYMLPNTGYVKNYNVIKYKEGFVLVLPSEKEPNVVPEFTSREKLFDSMMTTTKWGSMLGLNTVGDLNDQIAAGKINDLVLVQEALMERRIGEIAKEIANRKGIKFVMIAGPSSSGKTSFSHRLSIQLTTYGLKPHPIAVDDYFVNREDTPLDEDGNYNFECIEAIDTKQFNEDMLALLEGKKVEIPSFNFKIGKREYKGNYKQLGEDDILVIEGIHSLNDKMSFALPVESKFKIYISALTCLNIDEHNRIPTTDVRLLRRMVRDARTRGTSAKGTIGMWPSVRRGEEENIFPYQEGADAFFNSALIYELAALKTFAEPLLFQIGPDEPEYYEAKRLLKFLDYFLGITSEKLPNNSLVREFVGGSVFPV